MNSYSWLQAIIPDFPGRTSPAFLLMDEAQESFEDVFLWRSFLKDIIDVPSCYRVVVFCLPVKAPPEECLQISEKQLV